MQALKQEWTLRKHELADKKIASIYFGGGTPSALGPKYVAEILSWIPSAEEVTIEANPEDITCSTIQYYANAGINRVSIGVQSLNDDDLKILTRKHTAQMAMDAILITSKAGVSNISVDLMYDIPGQTLKSWQHTLNAITDLPIRHISLYNLINTHTDMYKMATTIPLPQYEISSFAKPQFQSLHTIGYWTGRPYLGFGPSAASYWQGKRFRNIADIHAYCQALESKASPIDFEEELDFTAQQREQLVLGLRLTKGCELKSPDGDTLNAIHDLERQGLIHKHDHHIALTKKGILFYDTVASILI